MKEKINAWFKIARLHFYPMAIITYCLGNTIAYKTKGQFDLSVFLFGYGVLFLIELSAIFMNEYFDYETDSLNKNYSMFTGGTRMLVEGRISFRELKIAIAGVISLLIICGFFLIRINSVTSPIIILFLIVIGVFMGLGYTSPPLKFSYRGLGEIVVGITHSIYLVVYGYALQTGTLMSALPVFFSIPLFFSVFAAITLAGLPDRLSDSAVTKKTIAVVFGSKTALIFSAIFICFAALSGFIIWYYTLNYCLFVLSLGVITSHALILMWSIYELFTSENYNRRVDKLMTSSLIYIIWFGLIPLGILLD
jgi:1,4-dihydroxy-2-naphthoate octaprenyltransferase